MSLVFIKELGNVITGNTPSKNNVDFYSSDDIGFIKPDILCDEKITYLTSANELYQNKPVQKHVL